MPQFSQDWSYTKYHKQYSEQEESETPIENEHEVLLNYVYQKAQKGNVKSCIDAIDEFCSSHWMMNVGPDKVLILKDVLEKAQPKKILQLGGYCGYSSLVFSYLTKAQIYTVEISPTFAKIASNMQEFAGVKERNHIIVGTVGSMKKEIQQHGPYDAILIDHAKQLYVQDLELLQSYGVVRKGTLVLGDNTVYPGAKGYLEKFRASEDYKSILYHTYLEYCNIPDALLVSEKL